jgi:hypothetical protein
VSCVWPGVVPQAHASPPPRENHLPEVSCADWLGATSRCDEVDGAGALSANGISLQFCTHISLPRTHHPPHTHKVPAENIGRRPCHGRLYRQTTTGSRSRLEHRRCCTRSNCRCCRRNTLQAVGCVTATVLPAGWVAQTEDREEVVVFIRHYGGGHYPFGRGVGSAGIGSVGHGGSTHRSLDRPDPGGHRSSIR